MTDHELAAHVANGGKLRALLLELWQRTRMDWGFVTDRLASTFRKEKWLGGHERRFVGEVLYGLVRHLRRIDLAIARGRGRGPAKPPRDLERLIALLVVEKLLSPAAAARAVADIDWAAAAGVDDVIAGERKLERRIALAASLPDWLAARFVADWGEEAEALARGLNERAPMTVRANLIRGSRAAAAEQLRAEQVATHEGTWSDTALIVESRTNLFALTAFREGWVEVQDEGSQLLADVAAACAGARPLVVDYCAGAGGKTLALAARMGNTGRLLATDIEGGKLEELRRRARRGGVSIAQAVTLDPTAPPSGGAARAAKAALGPTVPPSGGAARAAKAALGPTAPPSGGAARAAKAALGPTAPPSGGAARAAKAALASGAWPAQVEALRGKADVVLVDAPCTGIGALRRNPEARWRLAEADLPGFAARQREIVETAAGLCAPGGRILYATCSLLRCENQDVVASLAGVRPVPLAEVLGEGRARQLGDGGSLTVAPHKHGTDGFFAQILARV